MKSDRLLQTALESGYESIDQMTRMIGYGRLSAPEVVNRVISHHVDEQSPDRRSEGLQKRKSAEKSSKAVKVMGRRDAMMQLSKCCLPIPGDPIMGYMTRGRGLTIHAVGCPNLEAMDYDKDRFVDVEWDAKIEGTHSVKVSVLTIDRPGVLANVSSAISSSQANISRAEITTRDDQKAILDFVIEISNTLHLERTLEAVTRIDGVISAKRVRGWEDGR